jgi:hypothetical protein
MPSDSAADQPRSQFVQNQRKLTSEAVVFVSSFTDPWASQWGHLSGMASVRGFGDTRMVLMYIGSAAKPLQGCGNQGRNDVAMMNEGFSPTRRRTALWALPSVSRGHNVWKWRAQTRRDGLVVGSDTKCGVPSGIRTRGLCLERAACWASYTMGTFREGRNRSIIAYAKEADPLVRPCNPTPRDAR